MPAVLNWQRNSGGFIDTDNRFKMMGTVLGVGVKIRRARLQVRVASALVTDNQAAPTGTASLVIGVRLGIDGSTVPSLDPVSGAGSVDWLGVWAGTYRVVPRSRTNGWDLHAGPEDTVEWEIDRTVTGVDKALWVITTPLSPSPSFPWVGFAYLETQLVL